MAGHVIGSFTVRVGWDPAHEGTVEHARNEFNRLVDESYDLYREDGTLLTAFDPTLGCMYADPRIPPPHVIAEWPGREDLPY